jgi:transglutaminase-like putative cysteine protease
VSAICRALVACLSTAGAAALAADFDPWTQAAEYELGYRVDLAPLLAGPHKTIRVWLPTPAESAHQKVRTRKTEAPWPYRETEDTLGNRFIYLAPDCAGPHGSEVMLHFIVQRLPDDGVKLADVRGDARLDPQRQLGPLIHIPLDGKVRELSDQASRGRKTDSERIRAFYDYVLRAMRYAKTGEGWGQGDVHWACTAGYGNCTDFHSLLLGLARAAHIPARFVMGFPIPAGTAEGNANGYHCWAEVFDRERGWVVMDASEAWKSRRYDDYFGHLPSDRIAFTVGRDLVLVPPQQGPPLNFLIYPYAEVDGQPAGPVPWKLHYRRLASHAPP